MYCIGQFCRICIKNDGTLINMNTLDNDNLTFLDKLNFCQPYLISEKTCLMLFICKSCCILLGNSYEFFKMCSKSKIILESYVYQLESISDKNTSSNLKGLMENNFNEIDYKYINTNINNSLCYSESENTDLQSNCDTKPIDMISNSLSQAKEFIHPTSSNILNSLLVKNKVPLNTIEFNSYNLQNCSNVVLTDRKVTKQGLEIIALYPTSTYYELPNIITNKIKTKTAQEMVESDNTSQFSELADHQIENTALPKNINQNETLLDFLPVSVELVEGDTEIHYNNINVEKNDTKLPILKLKLNKQNDSKIISKKMRCKVCPAKIYRKTVYKCIKCSVPICLSHALPFCQICIHEMPNELNECPRDVEKYPFFRIAKSLKRTCGYCKPLRHRKSRSQCNNCAQHICGEHKQYLCELCAIGYSKPIY